MEVTLIAGEFLYNAENQRKDRSSILCKVLHETLFYRFNLMNVFSIGCMRNLVFKKCLGILNSPKAIQTYLPIYYNNG